MPSKTATKPKPKPKPKSATAGYTKTARKDAKGRVVWKSKSGEDRVRSKSTSGASAGKLTWRKPASAAAASKPKTKTKTKRGGGVMMQIDSDRIQEIQGSLRGLMASLTDLPTCDASSDNSDNSGVVPPQSPPERQTAVSFDIPTSQTVSEDRLPEWSDTIKLRGNVLVQKRHLDIIKKLLEVARDRLRFNAANSRLKPSFVPQSLPALDTGSNTIRVVFVKKVFEDNKSSGYIPTELLIRDIEKKPITDNANLYHRKLLERRHIDDNGEIELKKFYELVNDFGIIL